MKSKKITKKVIVFVGIVLQQNVSAKLSSMNQEESKSSKDNLLHYFLDRVHIDQIEDLQFFPMRKNREVIDEERKCQQHHPRLQVHHQMKSIFKRKSIDKWKNQDYQCSR